MSNAKSWEPELDALAVSARNGDQEAYTQLFSAYKSNLEQHISYTVKRGVDREAAESGSHDGFMYAVKTFDEACGPFRAYLYYVLLRQSNRTLQGQREPRGRPQTLTMTDLYPTPSEQSEMVLSVPPAEDSLVKSEREEQARKVIEECCETMEPILQLVVRECLLGGRTTRDLAEEQDIPYSTMRGYRGQAKAELTERLLGRREHIEEFLY